VADDWPPDPSRRKRRGAGFDKIQPEPSQIGGVAETPLVRLPAPSAMFVARAQRLLALAPDHPLGDYLRFLATVVSAQAEAVVALPAARPIDPAQLAQRIAHAMPPLAPEQVLGDADFAATLAWLLAHIPLHEAPDAARGAADAVRAMSQPERDALAVEILAGAYHVDLVAESLFLAAALQVHLARLATQLDATLLQQPAEGVCPVCGGAPVSSLVVGWTQASKARYCACSLCGSLWNHVRIRCTACGTTEGIAYYTIEDATRTVGIEACTTCRAYIKHMQQHEDPELDPLADDVASYALDLLARNEDFHRAGLNPLFLTG